MISTTRCCTGLAALFAGFLAVPLSGIAGEEALCVELQAGQPLILTSDASQSKELFFGLEPAPAKADLHLIYTGRETIPGETVDGQTSLSPDLFAMRYGELWLVIGENGRAASATGERVALRQAVIANGTVKWDFDQALGTGEHFLLFERKQGEWQAVLKIVCVPEAPAKHETAEALADDKETAEALPGDEAAAQETAEALPGDEAAVQETAEALPGDEAADMAVTAEPADEEGGLTSASGEIRFTGLRKGKRTLEVEIACHGVPAGTVLQALLVQEHSGTVVQRVPGIVPDDGTLRLRFPAPFLGWTEGRYVVEIQIRGKTEARGTVVLPK